MDTGGPGSDSGRDTTPSACSHLTRATIQCKHATRWKEWSVLRYV